MSEKWEVGGRLIKSYSINIPSSNLYLFTKRWKADTAFASYLTLTPRLADTINTFIISKTFNSDSTSIWLQSWSGRQVPHPCAYYYKIAYPINWKQLLNCDLDTISNSDLIQFYSHDLRFDSSYLMKDGKFIISEKREYDNYGNCLSTISRCDSMVYKYDSLNRAIYESYNYNCDEFYYILNKLYSNDTCYTYGTQNGIKELSSIKVRMDQNYKEIHYYSDSSIRETLYNAKDQPLEKKKFVNNKLVEHVIFEYDHGDEKSEYREIANGKLKRKDVIYHNIRPKHN